MQQLADKQYVNLQGENNGTEPLSVFAFFACWQFRERLPVTEQQPVVRSVLLTGLGCYHACLHNALLGFQEYYMTRKRHKT